MAIRRTTSGKSHSSTNSRRAAPVRVHTFGACTVDIAGVRLGRNADIVISVLVFLTAAPGMQLSREAIMQRLWPDSPSERQRGNLRQALYKLRQMGIAIELNGELVVLDSRQVEPTFSVRRDVVSFDANIVRGNEPLGPFLLGFDTSGSTALDDWVETERERAHGDARRALAQTLGARHAVADWAGAEPLARWLLQFDPLNELATLVMAECLLLSGAKYEAIRLLDRYMLELGPGADDLRFPAATLRRRISAPTPQRISFAPTERHFIGRESVMADLQLCMRRARHHDGTATLLHGSAGMGKTRVLQELTKVAQIEGVRDMRASCRESDVMRPLSVFLDIVPDLMQMPGALGCSPEGLQALRRFTNEDGGAAERQNPSLPSYMPLAAGLRRAVVDLLLAISEEKPMLLTVEDVHWLDSASWEVMVDLVSRIGHSRVCLIMTSRLPHARPTPPERVPVELVIKELMPLTMESSLELAHAIGTDLSAHIDEELGEWFVHTSEGVPLFLRSLVNHWIETGNAGGIPPTLLGVIGQRLQSLSTDALYMLQTVALLGRHATLGMIESVLQMPYFRIVTAIDDLHKAGAFDSDDDGVLVCHELIGRLAVDRLGRNARRALHKRIADVLTSVDSESEVSPQMEQDRLMHLSQTGDKQAFMAASAISIRKMVDAGYSYEALSISDAALQHGATLAEDRDAILTLQAEALYRCGEYARLLKHPLSPTSIKQGLRKWEIGAPEQLLRWIESVSLADKGVNSLDLAATALHVATSVSQAPEIRLSAAALAIRISSNTCQTEIATASYAAGVGVLHSSTQPQTKRDELDMLYHTSFGDPELGGKAAENLLAQLSKIASATDRLSLAIRVAFALRHCGRLESAESLLIKIHAESQKERLGASYSYASYRLSLLYLDVGRFADAQKWFDEFGRLAPKAEPLASALFHLQATRLALHNGDVRDARFHSRMAQDAMDQRGHLFRHAYALGAALGIWRLGGQYEDTSIIQEALDVYDNTKRSLGQGFLVSEIALAMHQVGRLTEARNVIQQHVELYRRELGPLPYCVVNAQSLLNSR